MVPKMMAYTKYLSTALQRTCNNPSQILYLVMFDLDSFSSIWYIPAYFERAVGVGRELSHCWRNNSGPFDQQWIRWFTAQIIVSNSLYLEGIFSTKFSCSIVVYHLVWTIDSLTYTIYIDSVASYVCAAIAPGLLPLY